MTDNVTPEKLDLRSHDIAEDKLEELLRLFPEVRTEGGKLDFERLKLALGESVDVGKERYGMTWPGKAECFKTIQAPSMGTLRPCPEESVNFDTTENLIIEGDNLEVLKLLQKSYLGKVKMIYIDPPYNTGNDFIYPDNYTESLETYLQYTGQVDAEGKKFGTNTEAEGRFHTKWMNMIYPRLYLARNLLKDTGVIMISIDDCEYDNLHKICNEVFGEENFVASVVWEKGRKNDAKLVSVGHDYIVIYAKSKSTLSEQGVMWREAKPGAADVQAAYVALRDRFGADDSAVQRGLRDYYASLPQNHPARKLSRYGNVDTNGVWRDDNMSWPGPGGPRYEVIHPRTKKACAIPDSGWRYSTPEKMQEMIKAGKVVFRADHTEPPIRKTYLVRGSVDEESYEAEDEVGIQVAGSYFYRSGLQAARTLTDLFGESVFDNPKDHEVLARWISYVGGKESDQVVLDFFAGSGSTAHAVLTLNAAGGVQRRFILVQLPEPTGRNDFDTVAAITRERVRRAIKALDDEREGLLGTGAAGGQDRGFRAYRLAESNFKPWNAGVEREEKALSKQLDFHVDHVRDGRTERDILYEILLKSGYQLTTPVETVTLASKKVYSAAGGLFLMCLERPLTLEVIRAMADRKPERVVCLDAGFAGNDQLKANAVQIFKTKGIESFRTV